MSCAEKNTLRQALATTAAMYLWSLQALRENAGKPRNTAYEDLKKVACDTQHESELARRELDAHLQLTDVSWRPAIGSGFSLKFRNQIVVAGLRG